MDWRLFEAAQTGDVSELFLLLKENPLMLDHVALASAETPLHVASMAGHLNFVKEITRLKPAFAKELNQEGFSPLHFASANGHVEIVRELLRVDHQLCCLKGRDRRVPLHFAAIKGRIDVISELLSACSKCVEHVTARGETALHLAVKNNQFEALQILIEWMKEFHREDLLSRKDNQGNTVLHLATSRKQLEVIELLLSNGSASNGVVEVNATNRSGLTALDVLQVFPSEAGDREIEEILRKAGAMEAQDVLSPTTLPPSENHAPTNEHQTSESRRSQLDQFVEYFKFKKDRDSPSEARSALLVIAVLITTATYQAGLNPPGGVWQEDSITNTTKPHFAGQTIMATSNVTAFGLFVFFNSVGFSVSLFMINILASGLPLQLELQISLVALISTYNTVLINMTPHGIMKPFIIVVSAICPTIIPVLIKWIRQHSTRLKQFVPCRSHRNNQTQN